MIKFSQILANIEKLGIPAEFCDFKDFLLAHHALDKMVSKPVLPPDYREVLQHWREAWLALFLGRSITMTNKLHIIFHHLQVVLE